MSSGEPITDLSTGTCVFMLLLGLVLALWPLVVITNFRRYGESLARRGERTTAWLYRAFGMRLAPTTRVGP
jgi:hypothetical protein